MPVICKKLLKILFIIILSISTGVQSSEFKKCQKITYKNGVYFSDYLPIKEISIRIKNYRKWQVNNSRILTNTSQLIPSKFKKKFPGTLIVEFENNLKCSFKAKIRTSGDLKDHIIYKNGQVFQSLDVSIINGHINNITKFKLFLDGTRGNEIDEIFMTELLREFNYIAPRTQLVDLKINNQTIKMLFQEKATKELLEYHKRREGPILEGDEKYMMQYAAKVSNDTGINWGEIFRVSEIGTKIQLAKQTNSSWAMKNDMFKKNSFDALSKLNYAYLTYLSSFKDGKNNYSFLDYHLDNTILGQNSNLNYNKLNIFNNILLAANGNHALYPHNRKFYWNSIEEYFEPIYYDGEFIINKTQSKLNYPLTVNYLDSIKDARNLITQLDKDKFYNKLKLKNLLLDKKVYNGKFKTLLSNIDQIEKLYNEKKSADIEYNNNIHKDKNLLKRYLSNIKNQKISSKLIQFNSQNNSFTSCNIAGDKCNEILNIEVDKQKQLLESKLKINKINYQFLNTKNNQTNRYKKIELDNNFFNNVSFNFNDSVDYSFDEKNKIFSIYQINANGKAFFKGGTIGNIVIQFQGREDLFKKGLANRYGKKNLTGCLSFIKIKFNDTKLKSKNSICEDGINIVNSDGDIKKIFSENSLYDGIDLDFSTLNIHEINIKNSLNDCVDFSGGNYIVKNSNLKKCADKAISIGENTKANFFNIKIINSNIGIASKDSSFVIVDKSEISMVKDCFAAYRKKQEFNGGYMKIENSSCVNFVREIYEDKYSEIIIANSIN